ncbi:MAG: bifunctional pyr operon transcriptional regulator/uracil phosphoribosyltransferase PyrR [Cyanobacteriota bacterium]|nr:bifunctional pyr operon transcriptional regulator/uracil phosphoribosyltransferase PyrR [Cyanobacteriota bacterium]
MGVSLVEILDASALDQTCQGLAADILAAYPVWQQVVLIGIRTRGVPLAHRLAGHLQQWTGSERRIPVGALDITFFRDDLTQSGLRTPDLSQIPGDLTQQQVILVDDVIFRGRTIRAALEALNHLGRPQVVRLAVLIDRGHRELPIHPDFVGLSITTQPNDQVRVHLREQDGEDRVFVEQN